MEKYDLIVLGAGASGLYCAKTAAEKGKKVVILDHNSSAGKKIIVSGGGRCNFTNLRVSHQNYLSQNPDFVKSALSGFPPEKIISFVKKHKIGYFEKEEGQLFLKGAAKQMLFALLDDCKKLGVRFIYNAADISVVKEDEFAVSGLKEKIRSDSLVIATGGLSYKELGASDLGYMLAEQFGHNIIPTRPGLVPLTFDSPDKKRFNGLSGVSANGIVVCGNRKYSGGILFTHKGISGPAVLQISLYWKSGEKILIKFMSPIPKRLSKVLGKNREIELIPSGTEGYRNAEVTVGGVDTKEMSSKTMMSNLVDRLYFVGEILDVAGELGGYNLHWAWASGFAAGNN